MTGPQHYQGAEDLLVLAANREPDADPADTALILRTAQVHATLALAAATALQDPEGGTLGDNHGAWHQAAGAP